MPAIPIAITKPVPRSIRFFIPAVRAPASSSDSWTNPARVKPFDAPAAAFVLGEAAAEEEGGHGEDGLIVAPFDRDHIAGSRTHHCPAYQSLPLNKTELRPSGTGVQ
jgi:hypothetical protein